MTKTDSPIKKRFEYFGINAEMVQGQCILTKNNKVMTITSISNDKLRYTVFDVDKNGLKTLK